MYRRRDHANGKQLRDDFCWKMWLSKGLTTQMLLKVHNDPLSSHAGVSKTLEWIKSNYCRP